ncbi:MAG TPA: hypothetical protein VIJ42_01900 [Stellaceae bacterium]
MSKREDEEVARWYGWVKDQLNAGISDEDLLGAMLDCHLKLKASAYGSAAIDQAFVPLHVASAVFEFSGSSLKRRPPSEIKRRLRVAVRRQWCGHRSPRPAGGVKAATPATQFLERVLTVATADLSADAAERVQQYALAKGTTGLSALQRQPQARSGQRGALSKGSRSLVETAATVWRDGGMPEVKITQKVRALKGAMDNKRRGQRKRSTR